MVRCVTEDLFTAAGIPLLEGRTFTVRDTAESTPVAIVSRSVAKVLWGSRSPLGEAVALGPEAPPLRVVGVVGDLRDTTTDADPKPILYRPHAQSPKPTMSFVVRAAGEPGSYFEPLHEAIWELDRDVSVYGDLTLQEIVDGTFWEARFTLRLLGLFAGLAVLLTAIGIHAVFSYVVSQRRREIGIRRAVGACRGDVLRLIMRRVLSLAASGIGLGLAASLALSRFLASQLYGVTATDPSTYSAVSLLLLATVTVAGLVPALRALRVHPIDALREP